MAVEKSRGSGNTRYGRLSVDKPRVDKATWEDAEPDAVWKTIVSATNAGDALMFSKTRDGGACVLTVLSGDDRIKQYATGEEELRELLALVRTSAEEGM